MVRPAMSQCAAESVQETFYQVSLTWYYKEVSGDTLSCCRLLLLALLRLNAHRAAGVKRQDGVF